MSISALKTWIAEILTPNDLNGEFTNNRDYIKENRDMVLGDDAEGSGFSGHNHNGTLGLQLTSTGLASDSVITAKILDANVTAAKLAADAVNQQRAVLTQRFKNCELVYEDTDNVTVSFPWTEIGGTAWSNVTGIDVSAETGSGGNVKAAVGANTASTWYYLYVSNTFTVGQPLVAEFLLTKVATGETGYTLIGAIYNDSGQEIEPFFQFGRFVSWNYPIHELDNGNSTSYVDVTLTIPAISRRAEIMGRVSNASATGIHGVWLHCQPNGETWVDERAEVAMIHVVNTAISTIVISGNKTIYTDSSQKIEYKIRVSAGVSSTLLANIYTVGYYVR